MKRIVYIGNKPIKSDNVAKTGLSWTRGEIHEVADDNLADKLLEHKNVWADADKDYKLLEEIPKVVEKPTPRVMIAPQGGTEVSAFWDPFIVTVTAEIFKSLQEDKLVPVFMKPEDADAYKVWKEMRDAQDDPSKMDKRSKQYKEWAEKHPEEAAKLLKAA